MNNLKVYLIGFLVFAVQSSVHAEIKDGHSSIYTTKVKRIVNALNLGSFSTEEALFKQLKQACKNNKCSSLETQTVKSVGQQLVYCQTRHLKAHGIVNLDATQICNSKQVMIGCDSLSTPLLRKMCYTGNKYSLKLWQQKERQIRSRKRSPASTH